MTPAQMTALSDTHRRVHGGPDSRTEGSTADLLALAQMKVV